MQDSLEFWQVLIKLYIVFMCDLELIIYAHTLQLQDLETALVKVQKSALIREISSN